jgi:predicted nucleotidyltransferase
MRQPSVKSKKHLPAAPAAVRLALDHLSPELPHGARVIVFGSHANGAARADSDIDLLVIEPAVADRAAEMVRLSTLLGRQLIAADVVVMSSEMFGRQSEITNTLAWRVTRQGVEYEYAH